MHYVIARKNGGVTILQTMGETLPEAVIAKWPRDKRDAVVSVREMSPDEEIADRTFRNAWTDTGRLVVDMDKARSIWREELKKEGLPIDEAKIALAKTPEELKRAA